MRATSNEHPETIVERLRSSPLTKTVFFAWIVAIIVLSVVRTEPAGQTPVTETGSGFGKHVVAYLLAVAVGSWAYPTARPFQIALLCGLVGLLGVLLELVQLFLTYRTFNPTDIIANLVGVALFIPIWPLVRGRGKAPSVMTDHL